MAHLMAETPKIQAEKFADLARELECNEDEAAFEEKLKRIATVKPRRTRKEKGSE